MYANFDNKTSLLLTQMTSDLLLMSAFDVNNLATIWERIVCPRCDWPPATHSSRTVESL